MLRVPYWWSASQARRSHRPPDMSNSNSNSRFVALAALDESHAGHVVVRVAANFARAIPGAELHLVHVLEDMPPPLTAVPRPAGLGDPKKDPVAKARQLLVDLAQEAAPTFGGRIVAHVAAGSPSKQTLQYAIDLQADVIMVGTHGRTGVKRMLLGSVAE